jgi:hypothetical protein
VTIPIISDWTLNIGHAALEGSSTVRGATLDVRHSQGAIVPQIDGLGAVSLGEVTWGKRSWCNDQPSISADLLPIVPRRT